ncbi:uncharacterized protein LOC120643112 [Panicum virgatum]|uniref:uncharacterized protein LOC120643112 n=1 Tax=Panicum virgatum TaxID=38727 RepID=UPI0019D69CEA|nr:uncharacterized protein LOC120643112 [Panicum virgatum]
MNSSSAPHRRSPTSGPSPSNLGIEIDSPQLTNARALLVLTRSRCFRARFRAMPPPACCCSPQATRTRLYAAPLSASTPSDPVEPPMAALSSTTHRSAAARRHRRRQGAAPAASPPPATPALTEHTYIYVKDLVQQFKQVQGANCTNQDSVTELSEVEPVEPAKSVESEPGVQFAAEPEVNRGKQLSMNPCSYLI